MERPLCKCHGEPMLHNSRQKNGNPKWACGRNRRRLGKTDYWERGGKERRRQLYEDRQAREVCVRCEGPLTTETLCWACLSYMEDKRAVCI